MEARAVLIQRLHVFRHVAAEEHAEIFDELESESLGKALQVFGARQVVERLQQALRYGD